MKTLARVILMLIGVAITGVALVALGVQMFLTPEKIKTLIENKAPVLLHRQIRFGLIDVGLFSGLELNDVKLSERPDFSQGIFFSADKVTVHPRLLPLLAKKFMINNFDLVKPRIAITRLQDGKTYNFSDLTGLSASSSTTSVAPPSASTSKVDAVTFLVSRARLQEGTLLLRDMSGPGFGPMALGANASTDAVQIKSLTAQNLLLTGPIQIETVVEFPMKKEPAELDLSAIVYPLSPSVTLKKTSLKMKTATINTTGEIKNLTAEDPGLDLHVALTGVDKPFLEKWVTVPAGYNVPGPLSGTIALNGTTGDTNASLTLSMASLTLSGTAHVKSSSGTDRWFDLKLNTNEFAIKDMLNALPADTLPKDVKLGGNVGAKITYSGTVSSGALSLNIAAQPLDMAYGDSFKKPVGEPMSWEGNGRFSTPTALAFPASKFTLGRMELSGPVSYKSGEKTSSYFLQLRSNSFPLEDAAKFIPSLQTYGVTGTANLNTKIVSAAHGPAIKGHLDLENGVIRYEELQLNKVKSGVDFNMGSADGSIESAGTLSANELTHDNLKGQDLKINWKLTGITPELSKINGTANLKQGRGEVQNIQKLMEGSKAARVFLLPLSLVQKLDKATKGLIKLPSLDRLKYKEIVGDYVFRSGVMEIVKFVMDASDISADMKGTVGLSGAQPLNLKATLRAAPGLIGGTAAQLLEDKDGRASITMNVKGTVNSPETTLETKEIKKKAVEEIKEKVLTEENIEKAKDFLKSILGK